LCDNLFFFFAVHRSISGGRTTAREESDDVLWDTTHATCVHLVG